MDMGKDVKKQNKKYGPYWPIAVGAAGGFAAKAVGVPVGGMLALWLLSDWRIMGVLLNHPNGWLF